MSAQPLFQAAPDESKLTERQAVALELVRTTTGGIQAVDVGVALHRMRAGDPGCFCKTSEFPCQYALSAGHAVLVRLRKLEFGLVRRRSGLWEIPNVTPKLDARGGPGELPEGF